MVDCRKHLINKDILMAIAPQKIRSQLAKAKNLSLKFSTKVKDSAGKELTCSDPRAQRIILAIMNQHAVNGGAACHWGGPSAISEMMSVTFARMFETENWFDNYNFVNDIGHGENGLYALRANYGYAGLSLEETKNFRSLHSPLTGHGESHLYPEAVLLSNGPLGSALPQAQGLAIADKVTGNMRKTICVVSDGASMEGEAKEAFSAIPGLFRKGKLNPFIMIVSDNNTKLSGRISEDSFSMNETFISLEQLGWKIINVDGHNIEQCLHAFDEATAMTNSPVCLRVKTIKGYGVESTEKSASGGHGFPLKGYTGVLSKFCEEIWKGGEIPTELKNMIDELDKMVAPDKKAGVPKEKIQVGIANALIRAAKNGKPVFSLSSDLQGSTGVAKFHKEFPEQYIDLGIAESNMVSVAAGMSKHGYIPVVDTFSAFGVTKGNLPLIMASLSSCPMICLYTHTGFQDAADGASHQSLTYMSALSSIPYVKVINLSCSEEADHLIYEAISEIEVARSEGRAGSSYVFFAGRETFKPSYETEAKYSLEKAQVLTNGDDATIVTTGSMIEIALEAANDMKEQGKDVTVIHNACVNSPDIKTIGDSIQKTGKLITIEDHQLIAGMGSQLIHKLKLAGHDFKCSSLGVKGEFGRSAYNAGELYKYYGMDSVSLVKETYKLFT